jgi:hypothetical protein
MSCPCGGVLANTEPLSTHASSCQDVLNTEEQAFFAEALAQARKSQKEGGIPIGSVIVLGKRVLRTEVTSETRAAAGLQLEELTECRWQDCGTWTQSKNSKRKPYFAWGNGCFRKLWQAEGI